MAFPLTQEQQEIVKDRGGELLVSAAAGSGKTRVLVERLLDRVIEERIDIDRFLIITFTKAAAAELRSRISQELTERLARSPTNRYLRRQSTLIYQTQISTIHSFCSMFLRENGHLVDLDSDFRLCEEGEAQILVLQALDQVLERRYAGLKPGDPFAQLADTLAAGRDDSRLSQIVLDIYRRIQSHSDPEEWLHQQKQVWSLEAVVDIAQTPWGALLLNDAKQKVAYAAKQMERLQTLCASDELLSANYTPSVEMSLCAMERFQRASSWDEAVSCMPIPFPAVGRKRKRSIALELQEEAALFERTEQVKATRERTKKRLEKVAKWFDEDSAAQLESMRLAGPAVQELMDLVLDVQTVYSQEKRRRNLVDFSDLEHLTAHLLTGDRPECVALAQYWSDRYEEVMVDEYQDTNQVQNAIFTAISHGGRTLFEVGDVKQSIYRFRLADPTIFLDKYESFPKGDQTNQEGPRKRILSRNFRSRPQVLLGCNDLFRAVMTKEFGELDYTEDQALVPGAVFPEEHGYELELDLIDLSFLGDQEGEKDNKDLLEARFAARTIREMLTRPFMVQGKDGMRPLRASDVMILLRSPGTVLPYYARALGEEGIPWIAEQTEEIFDTTEVNVALSMLQLVDNPRQDIPLIAALRSPVYGFTADKLALIRAGGEGDFYDAICAFAEQGDAQCQSFLNELRALRFGAGDKTCRQLIWHIYETSNLLGVFGAMDRGRERQENLLSLHALAGELEKTGCRTLFQFLLRLERLRNSGAKRVTQVQKKQGDGVTILSIHRSKGLEKPVVFLCGLSRRFNTDDLRRPVLFHPVLGVGPKGLDQQRMIEYPLLARRAVAHRLAREMMSEELRLLYVAMTRAKEKLVLTAGLTEGLRTIERLREDLDYTIVPDALEDQGSAIQWILLHALARPEAEPLREMAGLPNVTLQEIGPKWDIHWVEGAPLSQVRKIADRLTEVACESEEQIAHLKEQLTWSYPYANCVGIPSKLTATQLKGRVLDQEAAENAEIVVGTIQNVPVYRPDFIAKHAGLTPAQRGTAFHLALQHLSLEGEKSIDTIGAELDRMVDDGYLTALQRDAVSAERLFAFVSSPIGRAMAAAKECEREYKFSLLVPAEDYVSGVEKEQILLQGVIDAWFDDGNGITIIDFKSDQVTPGEESVLAEEYRPQLETYKKALSAILERPVFRCVLWFLSTGTAVEV